jgi:ADP-heptose:LPS heptosyltransferase
MSPEEELGNHDKSIRLKGYPPEHAKIAFKQEYYFEAITVLHGFIEQEMRSLLHLCISVKLNIPIKDGWDINAKLSYLPLTHVLLITKQINKNQYDILVSFNSLRNEVIHRYYYDPYDGEGYEISKIKFASLFNQALSVVKEIGFRAEDYA